MVGSFNGSAHHSLRGVPRQPREAIPAFWQDRLCAPRHRRRAAATYIAAFALTGDRRIMAAAQAPIDLYYWPTPNGWKITIALEEMGLPYAVHPVNISAGDQFKPEFLAISPNNKMPAIVDPAGPGGAPISVFESGAILTYLGRKTGMFYPSDERARVVVEQWLMWQMGGFGPMLGQNHHFSQYAPEKIPYAINRYVNETKRLYGVLDKQLSAHPYVAGDYSIADMAIVGWAKLWERQGQDITQFPHVQRWLEAVMARPAVARGLAVAGELRGATNMQDPKVQAILFGNKTA
jgi:GST-like protein